MKEIMEVAKYIRKELKIADEYAYESVKHKEQYPDMAQHYYRNAQEHLDIADDMHEGAVRLIEEAKRSGVEASDMMKRMWGFEHEMMIEEKECVSRKLAMFRS